MAARQSESVVQDRFKVDPRTTDANVDAKEDIGNDFFEEYPQSVRTSSSTADMELIMGNMVATFKRYGMDSRLFAQVLDVDETMVAGGKEYSHLVSAVCEGGLQKMQKFYSALRSQGQKDSNYLCIADALKSRVCHFGRSLQPSPTTTSVTSTMVYLAFAVAVVLIFYNCSSWLTSSSKNQPSLDATPQASQQPNSAEQDNQVPAGVNPSSPDLESVANGDDKNGQSMPEDEGDKTSSPPQPDCVITEESLTYHSLQQEVMANIPGFGDVRVDFCTRLGSHWHPLAHRLSLPDYSIDSIKSRCSHGKSYDCCMDVLGEWSRRDPTSTWEKLIGAVKYSNCALANKLILWLRIS